MPAIFISHSSLDQQIANDIKTALDQFGFEQVFLDFDKVTGFGAGRELGKAALRGIVALPRGHPGADAELAHSEMVLRRTVPGARAGQAHFADRLQAPR